MNIDRHPKAVSLSPQYFVLSCCPSALLRICSVSFGDYDGRDYEDAYSDPGSPMSRRTPLGTYVLAILENQGGFKGRQLLLTGSGASDEGNKPFVDLFDLETRETKRLFQSTPPHLERVSAIMSDSDDGFKAPITLDKWVPRLLLIRPGCWRFQCNLLVPADQLV